MLTPLASRRSIVWNDPLGRTGGSDAPGGTPWIARPPSALAP